MKFPLALFRVAGNSMLPVYQPGDMLLGLRWGKIKVGQVIVLQDGDRPIIKRVKRLDHRGIWLEGDNLKCSTDSRSEGWYSVGDVRARIIFSI